MSRKAEPRKTGTRKASNPPPKPKPKPKPVETPAPAPAPEPESESPPNYNDPAYINEKIADCFTVPENYYENIKSGDFIRYIGIDGNFRKGGYVWYKKEKDQRKYWIVGTTQTPPRESSKARKFVLYWDKIKKLWKRMDPETELLRKSIDVKADQIQDISDFLKKKFGDEFVNFVKQKRRGSKRI